MHFIFIFTFIHVFIREFCCPPDFTVSTNHAGNDYTSDDENCGTSGGMARDEVHDVKSADN